LIHVNRAPPEFHLRGRRMFTDLDQREPVIARIGRQRRERSFVWSNQCPMKVEFHPYRADFLRGTGVAASGVAFPSQQRHRS
jgi:hypothetical protein